MILKARQLGEVTIFELEGHLDFETTQQFRTTCESYMRKKNNSQIIFNLEKLKFVGSSGIHQFIKVLKDFNNSEARPKICHLSSEFEKVFKAYQTSRHPFDIYEDERQAIDSFVTPLPSPVTKAPRKRTNLEQ